MSRKKPEQDSMSDEEINEDTTSDYIGGRFLSRAQRNQAAFAKGVTGRCGCKDEGCKDCENHQMWTALLDSDAGVTSRQQF
jgi:hypothetical protein